MYLPCAGGQPAATCVGQAYVGELAAALGLSPTLLVLREASLEHDTTATPAPTSNAALLLLDVLPEPSGDLASRTPAAHLTRLKELVLAAKKTASRSLRATNEVLRLKPPHGTAEPLLAAAEISSARRMAAIPAAIAVGIVGAGILMALFALYSLARSPSSSKYLPMGDDDDA